MTIKQLDRRVHLNVSTGADIEWWWQFGLHWNRLSMMRSVVAAEQPQVELVSDASGSWGLRGRMGGQVVPAELGESGRGQGVEHNAHGNADHRGGSSSMGPTVERTHSESQVQQHVCRCHYQEWVVQKGMHHAPEEVPGPPGGGGGFILIAEHVRGRDNVIITTRANVAAPVSSPSEMVLQMIQTLGAMEGQWVKSVSLIIFSGKHGYCLPPSLSQRRFSRLLNTACVHPC